MPHPHATCISLIHLGDDQSCHTWISEGNHIQTICPTGPPRCRRLATPQNMELRSTGTHWSKPCPLTCHSEPATDRVDVIENPRIVHPTPTALVWPQVRRRDPKRTILASDHRPVPHPLLTNPPLLNPPTKKNTGTHKTLSPSM